MTNDKYELRLEVPTEFLDLCRQDMVSPETVLQSFVVDLCGFAGWHRDLPHHLPRNLAADHDRAWAYYDKLHGWHASWIRENLPHLVKHFQNLSDKTTNLLDQVDVVPTVETLSSQVVSQPLAEVKSPRSQAAILNCRDRKKDLTPDICRFCGVDELVGDNIACCLAPLIQGVTKYLDKGSVKSGYLNVLSCIDLDGHCLFWPAFEGRRPIVLCGRRAGRIVFRVL
jgi:hypothetical protein